MRDTTKHRKDDLVPKGFLYAISIMVVLSLYNRKKVGLELLDSYQIEIKRFASGRISLEDSKASWSLNVTSFGSKNSELFLSIF